MKKFTLIIIALIGGFQLHAQNINPGSDFNTSRYNVTPKEEFKGDSLLSHWTLDVNLTGGLLYQGITSDNAKSHYLNAVTSNTSNLNFTKGSSIGIDAEIGYFFDKKRNWGIGTGFWYMHQNGDVTMDNFHVEYQATDNRGNVYRQVLTANNPIHESLSINNFNIPLLLKYKNRFSKTIGFTADAGLLFNLTEKNAYTTDASFDYEAIYKFNGPQGNAATVYDNSLVPSPSDLLITKNQYISTHPTSNVQEYFNTLRSQGNNVGLGVKPNNNTGNISYKSGSVGFILRPAISFYLSDNVALNLGAYYVYQNFKHNSSANYKITDKLGEYSSVLNSVSSAANNSFGISFGIRFYLSKAREKKVIETAVAPEEEQPIPVKPEPVAPEDTADITPVVDMSTPILFDLNKTEIRSESYPILQEAIIQLNEHKKAHIVVHGYTDNTGSLVYNKSLSKKRAIAVKNYLHNKGVKSRLIKTIGHGPKSPAASNRTAEGRAQNRRAVMKLKQG